MSLLKKVIKANSQEHAQEIIKWWKSKGINTQGYNGSSWNHFPYYGLDGNGNFSIFPEKTVKSRGYEVIELPASLPKRGDIVLVWDTDERVAFEAIFLTYLEGTNNPVITVYKSDEDTFLRNASVSISAWRNYKPIPKEQPLVELTMDEALNELAKVKKVDVSRLRIKK